MRRVLQKCRTRTGTARSRAASGSAGQHFAATNPAAFLWPAPLKILAQGRNRRHSRARRIQDDPLRMQRFRTALPYALDTFGKP